MDTTVNHFTPLALRMRGNKCSIIEAKTVVSVQNTNLRFAKSLAKKAFGIKHMFP